MRGGKSKIAIDWACVLHLKHGITRILVVTHSPTTWGVWRNEVRKHCPMNAVIAEGEPDFDPRDMRRAQSPDCKTWLEFLIVNVQSIYVGTCIR
jgi:hypothetical protein